MVLEGAVKWQAFPLLVSILQCTDACNVGVDVNIMDDWGIRARTGSVLKPNMYISISGLSAMIHIIVNALASAQCTDAHGVDVDVSINADRGIRAARWLCPQGRDSYGGLFHEIHHCTEYSHSCAQCTDAHGVDVDVSINDDRGIRAARWLLRCQKQWPALRPLTLLLKAIMRVLELHDVSQGVYEHIVKS